LSIIVIAMPLVQGPINNDIINNSNMTSLFPFVKKKEELFLRINSLAPQALVARTYHPPFFLVFFGSPCTKYIQTKFDKLDCVGTVILTCGIYQV
jgi:hypothetical protein